MESFSKVNSILRMRPSTLRCCIDFDYGHIMVPVGVDRVSTARVRCRRVLDIVQIFVYIQEPFVSHWGYSLLLAEGRDIVHIL